MNQNSLIEVGSKADIILRFKSAITINGRSYAAKEPYLFLKDVNVLINYTNQDKSGSTDINVIAHSDIKPRSVSVGGVPFSRKIASLLAHYKGQVEYNPTFFRSLTAERAAGESKGYLFLVDEIDQNKEIFIYDNNFNLVEATYNSDLNAFESEDFIDQQDYYISFSSVRIGTKFDLNKQAIPYMSLEVQGKGNIEKITKNVVMYFDKVSLNSLLYFSFIQGDMINVPLEFYIIDDKNNYVIFED